VNQNEFQKMGVSVVVLAYNHETVIEEALLSILRQQTTFDVQILVCNDASTDKTALKIQQVEVAFPGRITSVVRARNVGMMQNMALALSEARYNYIAICEGDDYWVDNTKLQQQWNCLELNTELSLCFHPVDVLWPDGRVLADHLTQVPQKYETLTDVLEKGNYIHTCSLFFKRPSRPLPPQFVHLSFGDFCLQIWAMMDGGKAHRLPKTMATYRLGGSWSGQQKRKRYIQTCKTYALLMDYLYSEKPHYVLPMAKRLIQGIEGLNKEEREQLKNELLNHKATFPQHFAESAWLDIVFNPEFLVEVLYLDVALLERRVKATDVFRVLMRKANRWLR
jgi:glycosyltransferase involved in cell wall biosynthesis